MADDYGDDEEYAAVFAAAEKSLDSGNPSTAAGGKVVQPKPQALPKRDGPSAILVHTYQKGNPILNHVRSLPWEYSDIPADYVLGATTCALFLSLKYHRLHPEYIYRRIRELGKRYNLRLILVLVDIQNHEEALKELSKTSMINDLTLILCWSAQEGGRYLELFKSFEFASPQSIKAHQATTYKDSLTDFVTTPRNINKTDAASLISNFGSLRAAMNAQPEELALVPGWGEKKVKAWCSTVREPFRVRKAAKSGPSLIRMGSTADTGEDSGIDDRRTSTPLRMPVPISSVPSYSREASGFGPGREISTSLADEAPVKRQYDSVEPDDEDEDAVAAVREAHPEKRPTPEQSSTKPSARKDDPLSDGVMVALSKLRDKG